MVFGDFGFESGGVESCEGLCVSIDCMNLAYVGIVGEVAYDCEAYASAA